MRMRMKLSAVGRSKTSTAGIIIYSKGTAMQAPGSSGSQIYYMSPSQQNTNPVTTLHYATLHNSSEISWSGYRSKIDI
jgi:hypothetical protein